MGNREYLGTNPKPDHDPTYPVKVHLMEKIEEIQCGSHGVIVLSSKQHLYGWGASGPYFGSGIDHLQPDDVIRIPISLHTKIMEDRIVIRYLYNNAQTFLLTSIDHQDRDLRFVSAGENNYGELGIGHSSAEVGNWTFLEDSDLLNEIQNGHDIVSFTGQRHTLFILFSNHHLYVWGQLGGTRIGCPDFPYPHPDRSEVPIRFDYKSNDCKAYNVYSNVTLFSEVKDDIDNIVCSPHNCFVIDVHGVMYSFGNFPTEIGREFMDDLGLIPMKVNLTSIDSSHIFKRLFVLDSCSMGMIMEDRMNKRDVLYGMGCNEYRTFGASISKIKFFEPLFPYLLELEKISNSYMISESPYGISLILAAPSECFGASGIQACNYPNGICGMAGDCQCREGWAGMVCEIEVPPTHGKPSGLFSKLGLGGSSIIGTVLAVLMIVFCVCCFCCVCVCVICLVGGVYACKYFGCFGAGKVTGKDASRKRKRKEEDEYSFELPMKDDGSMSFQMSDKEVFSPTPSLEIDMVAKDPFAEIMKGVAEEDKPEQSSNKNDGGGPTVTEMNKIEEIELEEIEMEEN